MIDVMAIQKQNTIRQALALAPRAAPQGLNEVQGFTRFYIGANINDMREWSPERIRKFFDGIAQVIRAQGNAGLTAAEHANS